MMGPWFGWGFGGAGGWLMFAGMIIFWGLIIWGIVALVRWTGRSSGCHDQVYSESAVELLKKRYARGEIGKEEFEEKKKGLA
jgi:putative membrane protein